MHRPIILIMVSDFRLNTRHRQRHTTTPNLDRRQIALLEVRERYPRTQARLRDVGLEDEIALHTSRSFSEHLVDVRGRHPIRVRRIRRRDTHIGAHEPTSEPTHTHALRGQRRDVAQLITRRRELVDVVDVDVLRHRQLVATECRRRDRLKHRHRRLVCDEIRPRHWQPP